MRIISELSLFTIVLVFLSQTMGTVNLPYCQYTLENLLSVTQTGRRSQGWHEGIGP